MNMRKLFGLLALVTLFGFAFGGAKTAAAITTEPEICGEAAVYTLWGGKTIDVGTVTVANDETNLYVTYQTTGDWYLTEVHLYVLDYEPLVRLIPGHAPYKSGDIAYATSYTFIVPLANLGFPVTCDETVLWLQAHAAVVRMVDGVVVQDETAYGGDINPDANPWYGNIRYRVQCCNGEEPCYEFMGETAWAAGTRYVRRGNWATYTPYIPDSTVILYAGQTINVGTVHFSAPVDGLVTITIQLTGDWEFAPTAENVKIQDYAVAPSGNPAPGLFAWKGTGEGQSFSIQVPVNNFYGVHVDVGYWMQVACPVE